MTDRIPPANHLGFSGPRTGMTHNQSRWIEKVLSDSNASTVHHGACIGADAIMHKLAWDWAYDVIVHPPTKTALIDPTCMQPGVHVTFRPPKDYILRNHDIVDETQLMLFTPDGPEIMRSGTWSTIRYTRKQKKAGLICYPDGIVKNVEDDYEWSADGN